MLKEKIRSRMEELGIEPKRSLGQNFLVSDHVVSRIVQAAAPDQFSQTIEIGPGLGSLTDFLLEKAQAFKVVELDRVFAQFWRDKGVEVHEGDALRFAWADFFKEHPGSLLVSNLPYQISSRLVVDLSIVEPSFSRMVLMFQKEVAQRMQAQAGSKDFGMLTVIAQTFWDVSQVCEAGAVDFKPKPNVASRVLKFQRKTLEQPLDGRDFLNFVRVCFANRRKKMQPKLDSFADKGKITSVFNELGLDPQVRAEKLTPDQFRALYFALKTK